MSAENTQIVRRMIDSWQAGDFETALSLLAPDLEWDISAHPLPDWPDTGSGREEFARHLSGYIGGWREYRAKIDELIDAGDEVVVILHESVGLRESEASLDRELHHSVTVKAGLITQWRTFKTMKQATAAAGLGR